MKRDVVIKQNRNIITFSLNTINKVVPVDLNNYQTDTEEEIEESIVEVIEYLEHEFGVSFTPCEMDWITSELLFYIG